MAKKRKRAGKAPRDMFDVEKGTEITIKISAGVLHMIDALRDEIETRSGVTTSRAQVFQGMVNKVWFTKFVEASTLAGGDKVTGQIEEIGKRGGK